MNSDLLFSELPVGTEVLILLNSHLVSFVQKHKLGRCYECPEAGKGPSPGRVTAEEGSGQTPAGKGQVEQARTEGEREKEDTERREEAVARNIAGLFSSSPLPNCLQSVYGAVYGLDTTAAEL